TVTRAHLRLDPKLILGMMRLWGTATLQFLVGTASWVGLVRLVATYGSSVVAGYTVAMRLVVIGLMPAWGLSNAAATMVGQALGARDPDRANASVWVAARINLAFLGTLGILLVAFAPDVVGLFSADVEVSEIEIGRAHV